MQRRCYNDCVLFPQRTDAGTTSQYWRVHSPAGIGSTAVESTHRPQHAHTQHLGYEASSLRHRCSLTCLGFSCHAPVITFLLHCIGASQSLRIPAEPCCKQRRLPKPSHCQPSDYLLVRTSRHLSTPDIWCVMQVLTFIAQAEGALLIRQWPGEGSFHLLQQMCCKPA